MTRPALALAAVAALAALPFVASPFTVSLAMACLMYAGLAVSWALFSGLSRTLSLAVSAFFGLGAYAAAWGLPALPWAAVLALGAAAAAAFAAGAGLLTLRLRGAQFAVITFGLGELVKYAVTFVEKAHFGTVGRIIAEPPEDRTIYLTLLALAVLAVLAFRAVDRSRLGLALRGLGADELRAATLGVDGRRARLLGFVLSASFAGAIGAAASVRWTYVDPRSAFDPFIVFQTVLIAMVGGPTRVVGPVVGAVALTLLSEVLRLRLPYLYMIVLGVLLVLSVLYLPDGLAGLSTRRRLSPVNEPVPEGTDHA
jgi:branched-chain amino acid transport system permease protein